jgi:hypothetical protein
MADRQSNLNSAFQVDNITAFTTGTGRDRNSYLDEFRSEISRGGIAKTNKFQANINPPGPADGGSSTLRSIMLRTNSVELPGNTLDTETDSNIYGPNRNIVAGVSYADTITMRFILDEYMEVRKYFEDWQKLMYNQQTWNIKYYDEYHGTIDVFLLDQDHSPTSGYRIWEAYPSTIGPIELAMEATDPFIQDFSVSFSFRYYSDIGDHGTQQPSFNDFKTSSALSAKKEINALNASNEFNASGDG